MTTVITSQVRPRYAIRIASAIAVLAMPAAHAQLTDLTQTPNAENAGIVKSLSQQIGTGVGNVNTPGSSLFIIKRDPARSIRRGRQLFQRKFTVGQDRPAHRRRRRRYRGGWLDRRRPGRQLRGVSRTSARLGGLRWRCGHASGQP